MNPKGGGPAFPVTADHRGCVAAYGMTLRDWFAGMALQGMLSYYNPERGDCHTNATADEAARYAYEYADAMLAARNGKEDA